MAKFTQKSVIWHVTVYAIIAYGVQIATGISGNRYNLEVNGQGRLNLNFVRRVQAQIHLSFYDRECAYLAH